MLSLANHDKHEMAVTAEQPGWEKLEIEDYRNSFGFGFRELVMTKEGPPVEFTIRLLEGASLDVILTRSGLSVRGILFYYVSKQQSDP